MFPRIVILSVAFLLLFTSASHAAEDVQAYDLFRKGMALEEQLRIDEARDRFIQALAVNPDNTGYLSHYAWFLTTFGYTEEAVQVFGRLLPHTNDTRTTYLGRGWAQYTLGRLDASLADYRECFPPDSLNTSDIKASFRQVKLALSQENAAKIATLKEKIASHPDDITSRKSLLKVYLDQGEFDNVSALAADLRKTGDLDLTSQLWLARALYWSGDTRQAESEYRALIAASPQSAFLRIELAGMLASKDHLPEARPLLEEALALYPETVSGRKLMAEVMARQGDGNKAVAVAESIPTDGTDRLTGLMARARAFHFGGHPQIAGSLYETVLREYPYQPDALWGMTETSIYSGRYANAGAALKKWEDAIPDERIKSQKKLIAAYTAPQVSAKMDAYNNSEDFTRINTGEEIAWYSGNSVQLSGGHQYSYFAQTGFNDQQRNAVFLGVKAPIGTELRFDGRLSGLCYDSGRNTVNGDAALAVQVTPKWSIRPSYRHVDIIDTVGSFKNMVYGHIVNIGAVGLGITSDEYGFSSEYQFSPRLTLYGDTVVGDYSDGNRKEAANLGGIYRFSFSPDLRAGYNFSYLDYEDQAPSYQEGEQPESPPYYAAYYDPISVETHTLRFLYQHDKGTRWIYGGETALSFTPDCSGTGLYLDAYTGWRIMPRMSFRLDARWFQQDEGVLREGTSGRFWADHVLFTFDYRF